MLHRTNAESNGMETPLSGSIGSGIYKITCLHDGRNYIGSSQKAEWRLGVHRHRLNHGKHENSNLQKAWDVLGEGEFSFEVLLWVADMNDLLFYEQVSMERYHAWEGNGGFNHRNKARAARGYKHSEPRPAASKADFDLKARGPFRAVGCEIFDRRGNLIAFNCRSPEVAKYIVLCLHFQTQWDGWSP